MEVDVRIQASLFTLMLFTTVAASAADSAPASDDAAKVVAAEHLKKGQQLASAGKPESAEKEFTLGLMTARTARLTRRRVCMKNLSIGCGVPPQQQPGVMGLVAFFFLVSNIGKPTDVLRWLGSNWIDVPDPPILPMSHRN